ncbi:hypothetical protein STA3757_02580 [Stanieria sp. NIES-3757]|nr:hypothetical protein STA3757_02580 [Stanieria sp. NIES-3757]
MQDNGQNINGSLDTATYTHQLQGTHFSREQASVTIYRTYRGVPSCTTKMFGNMTSSSPFQMTIAIQGTDGNCDLPRNFSSSVIYFKR